MKDCLMHCFFCVISRSLAHSFLATLQKPWQGAPHVHHTPSVPLFHPSYWCTKPLGLAPSWVSWSMLLSGCSMVICGTAPVRARFCKHQLLLSGFSCAFFSISWSKWATTLTLRSSIYFLFLNDRLYHVQNKTFYFQGCSLLHPIIDTVSVG